MDPLLAVLIGHEWSGVSAGANEFWGEEFPHKNARPADTNSDPADNARFADALVHS